MEAVRFYDSKNKNLKFYNQDWRSWFLVYDNRDNWNGDKPKYAFVEPYNSMVFKIVAQFICASYLIYIEHRSLEKLNAKYSLHILVHSD